MHGSRPASRADSKGKDRAASNGDLLALEIAAEEGMAGGSGYQHMQLVEQQASVLAAARRMGLYRCRTITSSRDPLQLSQLSRLSLN